MSVVTVLAIAGITGALIDLALHIQQLWPKLVPSHKVVCYLTATSGFLILASCMTAFNWAACVMGIVVVGMASVALVTGKEVH